MSLFSTSRRTALKKLAAGALGSAGLGGLTALHPAEGASSASSVQLDELIYENLLAEPSDVEDFRLEGQAAITFPQGRMRMENVVPPSEGQNAHFVHWCPETFPGNIAISWDFWPVYEPGLCILFFAAKGRNGESIFDPSLATRTGRYPQYHSGDINAMHIAYFRRSNEKHRAFHICNLRKSEGAHLAADAPDPIPSVETADPPYRIQLVKDGLYVSFSINNMLVLDWTDEEEHGPVLGEGKIGFRQMAPLIAEYANLKVHTATS